MWTFQFDLNGPTRLGRIDARQTTRQASVIRLAAPVAVCAALFEVYAAYVAPVSIDPTINGARTSDPAIEVTGSGPLYGTSLLILRNGYAWPANLAHGRFRTLVPLLPGLNRIQAEVDGRISAMVEVEGPKAAAANVSTAMVGECSGVIAVDPASGYDGDSALIVVNLDKSAQPIARVTWDSVGGCRECDTDRTAPNQFAHWGVFHGSSVGTLRITFKAFDKDGKVRCQGESADLTVLGHRRTGQEAIHEN